ncbi:hypothetical protein MBLNU459_g0433t1 [Dothideomycetes sp. NU459]
MASYPLDDSSSPLPSPSPPTSPDVDEPPPPPPPPSSSQPSHPVLSPRSASSSAAITAGMTASSTPLGNVNAARRPAPSVTTMGRAGSMNPDIAARLAAFRMSRQGAPPPGRPQGPVTPGPQTPGGPAGLGQPPSGPPTPGVPGVPAPAAGGAAVGGIPSNFRLPPGMGRPNAPHFNSAPAIPKGPVPGRGPSLAEKRGLKLGGGLAGPGPAAGTPGGPKPKPKMTLSAMNAGANGDGAESSQPAKMESAMDRYAEFIDKETGSLKFKGKATLNSKGVQFASGQSFNISLDEVDTLDELGKGNYGTVYKVRHSRPQMRRPGQGLAGNRALPSQQNVPGAGAGPSPTRPSHDEPARGNTTGIVMAMKEMRLELDEAKFATIIMELDVLHRCASPFIVDFYGAFFQEGAVYICMEFMDGGSIDKIYGDGIPEGVLRKITFATTRGLKSLKDEHNIIHRDVKPTNILVNSAGAIKICDFGVSGNLVASIAKTNIGCQSYMAPERISSGGVAQAGANPGGGTYSVQSDIWSLGLTIIECAMGRYPYPPETYGNIFSQLSAIVDGEPPDLPKDTFSEVARNFVAGCLNKIPKLRPTYAMLLQHAWLAPLSKIDTISEEDEEESPVEPVENGAIDNGSFIDREVGEWVLEQIDKRKRGVLGKSSKPALHAAPLDVASPVSTPNNKGAVAV